MVLKGKIPYELLYNKQPTIDYLKPFYTKCYIHIPEEQRGAGSKLNARALEGHLVGYTGEHMFRVYIPSKHSVDEYRQVRFAPNLPTTDVEISSSTDKPKPSSTNLLPSSARPSTPPPNQELTMPGTYIHTLRSSTTLPISSITLPPSSMILPPSSTTLPATSSSILPQSDSDSESEAEVIVVDPDI